MKVGRSIRRGNLNFSGLSGLMSSPTVNSITQSFGSRLVTHSFDSAAQSGCNSNSYTPFRRAGSFFQKESFRITIQFLRLQRHLFQVTRYCTYYSLWRKTLYDYPFGKNWHLTVKGVSHTFLPSLRGCSYNSCV